MLSHLVILSQVRCAALLTICICIAAGVSPGVNSPHRADALVIKLLFFVFFLEKQTNQKNKTRANTSASEESCTGFRHWSAEVVDKV